MTKRRYRSYTLDFKLQVLSDYYQSGKSVYFIAKKWGIPTKSTIESWKKAFPIDSKVLSLSAEAVSSYKMKHEKSESREEMLQQRISELERALAIERMRSRGFEKMIEIAEREEGISILKKGGAKQ